MSNCLMCGRLLDTEDIASRDCGGDCLGCLAECGDPDCIDALVEANIWTKEKGDANRL